jgi:hypothetical protein
MTRALDVFQVGHNVTPSTDTEIEPIMPALAVWRHHVR